jgi:hypothetical protein
MSNKEVLSTNIKKWLQLEKEMKLLQTELKERRKKKNDLTNILVDLMKKNDIECLDISDGKIIYTQNNSKGPLNKKYLSECLEKYFSDNSSIPTEELVQFILENRTTTIKETIRLKPTKNI